MLIVVFTGKRPLIREMEQFPAIASGTRREGGGTGQLGRRAIGKRILLLCTARSNPALSGRQRHKHEKFPGLMFGRICVIISKTPKSARSTASINTASGRVGRETRGPTAQTLSRGPGSAVGLKGWTDPLSWHKGVPRQEQGGKKQFSCSWLQTHRSLVPEISK